jgi:hypothetical protein
MFSFLDLSSRRSILLILLITRTPNQFSPNKTQRTPWLPKCPRMRYRSEVTWHRLHTVECRNSFVPAVASFISLSNRANSSAMKRCHTYCSRWCLSLASICAADGHLQKDPFMFFPWFARRSIVSAMPQPSYFFMIAWVRFKQPSNSPRTVSSTVSGLFELNDERDHKIVRRSVIQSFSSRSQCKTWRKWSQSACLTGQMNLSRSSYQSSGNLVIFCCFQHFSTE